MSKIDRKPRPAAEEAGSSLREANPAYIREMRRTAMSAAIAFVVLLIGGTLYLNRGPTASQSAGQQRAANGDKPPAVETADEEFDRLQREKLARLGVRPGTVVVADAAAGAAPETERSKPELEVDPPAAVLPVRPDNGEAPVTAGQTAAMRRDAATREAAPGGEHPLPTAVETSVSPVVQQTGPVRSSAVGSPPRTPPKPLVAEAPIAVDTPLPVPAVKAPHSVPAIVTAPPGAPVAIAPVPAPAPVASVEAEQQPAAPVPAPPASTPRVVGPGTRPAPALVVDTPEPAPASIALPAPVRPVTPAPATTALPVAAKAGQLTPQPTKLTVPVMPGPPAAVTAGAGFPHPAPIALGPLAALESPPLPVEPVARAPLATTPQPSAKAPGVPESLAKDPAREPSKAPSSEPSSETGGEPDSMWRSLVASVSGMLRPSRQLDTLDTATIQDCPDCPVLALVRPGYFATTVDGRRSVRTRISRPFALGQSPVTVAQYARFVALTGRAKPKCDALDGDPMRPVTCVAVEDARDYVKWLGGQSGQVYRLPSAAEWEYASGRAGEQNPDEPDPTIFAVRHMGGKVAEIAADCWLGEDTVSPSDGSAIIVDGGCRPRVLISYGESETALAGKTALRRKIDYGQSLPHVGFRIARELVLTRRY